MIVTMVATRMTVESKGISSISQLPTGILNLSEPLELAPAHLDTE